ncbi:MAG TPA: hypothetical protein VMW12_09765 [Candidatus Dormibacteraeota bacterium]|nr:hypothetical protein [Candidatus Dormibacteraeota bacterium]
MRRPWCTAPRFFRGSHLRWFPALATVFAQAPYRISAVSFGGLFVPLTLGAIVAAIVLFPLAIAAAFVALPLWSSAPELIAGFALGGVACSIVFSVCDVACVRCDACG